MDLPPPHQQRPLNSPGQDSHAAPDAPPDAPPRFAIKLKPEAQKKQQDDPGFITQLIRAAQTEPGAPPSAGPADATAEPDPAVRPLVAPEQRAAVARRVALATERDPRYTPHSFDAWYQVEVPAPAPAPAPPAAGGPAVHRRVAAAPPPSASRLAVPEETLRLLHRLHALDEVESVQILGAGPPPGNVPPPAPGTPPATTAAPTPGASKANLVPARPSVPPTPGTSTVNAADDPRSAFQGYLDAAPRGIDARYAWRFPGGDGAGATVVDLEQGWDFDHEDLVSAPAPLARPC